MVQVEGLMEMMENLGEDLVGEGVDRGGLGGKGLGREEERRRVSLGKFEAHTPTEDGLKRETHLNRSKRDTELEGERSSRRRRGSRNGDGVGGGGGS